MNLSPSIGGNEGSELDIGLLKQYLPGLEDFEIDERLAGTYVRYRATHAEAALPVWVHHFTSVDAPVMEGLATGFESLKQLQDPAFLRPLGHVAIGGGLLLVTDAVVEGNRLDSVLQDLDPGQARIWAGELSQRLGILHEHGILHGRLCPQAIYMTKDGPKILGAGYSDLWIPVWEAMDESGNFPPRLFTSLEVRLDGVSEAGVSADVLSLGTILYRGYTGGFPGEFCPLPSDKAEVPRSVDGAIMISMHPEAASRQQSMDEFIDEFTGVRVRDSGKWEPRVLADNLSTGSGKKKHRLDGQANWLSKMHFYALAAVILGLVGWKGAEVMRKKAKADPPIVEKAIEKPEPEPEKKPKVVVDESLQKIDELLRYADLAAGQEDWFLEREALQQALQLEPDNVDISGRLAANPWQVREEVSSAIKLLKLSNPRQTEWRILADFERDGCRLDLSGNGHLTNVSVLANLRLVSLDLSGTNVVDLSPLVESPPRELRAVGLPIGEISSFDPEYTTVTTKELPFPSPGQCWESPSGLRFSPILDGRVLLAKTEVTRNLFERFATQDEGLGDTKAMLSLHKGEWAKLGHNWRRPGYETHPEEPIVGVSREEAERFCHWLTLRDRNTGKLSREETYRLPTDYEWGVAAGLQEHSMHDTRGRDRLGVRRVERDELRISEGFKPGEKLVAGGKVITLSPVGKRLPDFAFYDLWGNAREWVSDSASEKTAVARGGVEGRMHFPKETRRQDIGFRVVLDLGGVDPRELDDLVERRAWQRAREVALADAFNPRNLYAREAGRAFLQSREKVESGNVSFDWDPAFTLEHGRNRFQLVRFPMDWEQARRFARDSGGRLACADDPRLLHWLTGIGGETPTSIWLGARRDDGGWIWEDGAAAKRVTLPKTDSIDDRLVLTSDRALEAIAATERNAFVIEWKPDPERTKEQNLAGRSSGEL